MDLNRIAVLITLLGGVLMVVGIGFIVGWAGAAFLAGLLLVGAGLASYEPKG